jgi:hypothetical protein
MAVDVTCVFNELFSPNEGELTDERFDANSGESLRVISKRFLRDKIKSAEATGFQIMNMKELRDFHPGWAIVLQCGETKHILHDLRHTPNNLLERPHIGCELIFLKSSTRQYIRGQTAFLRPF